MAKKKSDSLFQQLRDSGVRKKVASKVSEALPDKGPKMPAKAHEVADQLTKAAESIRERAGGGSRTRSAAAKKAAQTRKANAAKRSASARKAARTRAKAKG